MRLVIANDLFSVLNILETFAQFTFLFWKILMLTLRNLFPLSLVLCFNVWASESPYFTSSQINIAAFLPAPVVNGSDEDMIEQEAVLAAQKSATPARIALANSDAEEGVFDMFSRVLGPNFKSANLPIFTAMFKRIGDTEDATVDPVKAKFGRVRPFMNNPSIKALVKPSSSGSYPSGHTTRSTMMGIILASMLPERKEEIFARAEEYAQSRVIGGMHYPADIEGGRRAGIALAACMLASPTFMADFDAAREELRKILKF